MNSEKNSVSRLDSDLIEYTHELIEVKFSVTSITFYSVKNISVL